MPDPALASRWGKTLVSPANAAVSEYDPAFSFGVIWHDATPLASVMTVTHDCVVVPFSVIVTGSLAAGRPV